MDTSKHTPGPWYVNTNWPDRFGYLYVNATQETVAQVHPNDYVDANARLIAAAPEMRNELDPDSLDQVAGLLALVAGQRHAAIVANLREKVRRERALLARIDGGGL